MDHGEMHHHNTARTLDILYRCSPITMAKLTKESGLARRTIEVILENLIAKGWAKDSEASAKGVRSVGRPARTFSFSYDAACILAIQLEAGHISATVADLAANPLAARRQVLPIATSRQERLRLLGECIEVLLAEVGRTRSSVLAVTVSTPGIVQDDGTVELPFTMPEWSGFSLSEAVGQLFDCPVQVENDAKLAALGEKNVGGLDAQDFVYLYSDSERLGIGLVLRNELRRGVDGAAGEISWAPALGLRSLTSPLLVDFDDEGSPNYQPARDLVAAAREGDARALAEVDKLAQTLAPGITTIAWLLAPQEIILGGGLGEIQDLLVPALERILQGNERPITTHIRGSKFGQECILNGCLRMCIESLGEILFEASELSTLSADPVVSAEAAHV